MEFPITVESQDDFDKLVGARITREREKYADYDGLKTEVATLRAATESHEAAVQAEKDRADAAEKWKVDRESADALDADRASVAKEFGVPANALRGSSKKDFEAHAADLKPLVTAQHGPVIPNQGTTPTVSAAVETDRAFADFLTGRTAD